MRIKRLDILRCVAVILVLVYHGKIIPVFNKIGWAGVDLFFVLSGFLISGLLYSEFKQRGQISFRRFFIRRSLKIYPAFFIMILVTLIARRITGAPDTPQQYFREILFVQNYHIGIWQHTWSLAVEEHFYIFLPIVLLALIRFSRDRKDPFNSVPCMFAIIAACCLLFRAATIYYTAPLSFAPGMVTNPTHDRIDSLFFGVFLGYLHHFHPARIEEFFGSPSKRIAIGLFTLTLLSVCFLFTRASHFLLTFGLSFLYLGFGSLLLMSIQVHDVLPLWMASPLRIFGTVIAFIGTYSYSIYLWHIPFQAFAPGACRRFLHVQFSPAGKFWFYLFGSVVFGILMATLIEFPVLRLRDRFFPAKQTGRREKPDGSEMACATATPSRGS